MKKKLIALLSVLALSCTLTACSFSLDGLLGSDFGDTSDTVSDTGVEDSSDTGTDESSDTANPEISDTDTDTSGNEQDKYTYTAFSPSEKKIFTDQVGFVIPFAPSDEYYVEDYMKEYPDTPPDEFSVYINYYTIGNTQADFTAYKALFDKEYTFVEEYKDDYGDTCYVYCKGDAYVDMSYYLYDGEYFIDVYVYIESTGGGSGGNQGGSGGGNSGTDFTTEEKALFNEYFGFVIPFLESEEYYVEEYSQYYEDTDETEIGVNYYTFGNTQAEFDAYKALFSTANGYTYDGTDQDEYGDAW